MQLLVVMCIYTTKYGDNIPPVVINDVYLLVWKQDLCRRGHTESSWVLHIYDWCPCKWNQKHTQEIQNTLKGWRQRLPTTLQKLGERHAMESPQGLQGAPTLPTFGFQTSPSERRECSSAVLSHSIRGILLLQLWATNTLGT